MVLKLFLFTALFSSLMVLTPQKSYGSEYCKDVAMKYHRDCLSWGVSTMACAEEAHDVFNDCLKYDSEKDGADEY